MLSAAGTPTNWGPRNALNLVGRALWYAPFRFGIASLFGTGYQLRSVLFHNVTDKESPFTYGIRVNTSVKQFEEKLRYIIQHYRPVRLEDVLQNEGKRLPSRAILVTFDDAYASVCRIAAPLCKKYGIPAVFFVNAAFIDNRRLAADNVICYVAREFGFQPIASVARRIAGDSAPTNVPAVFSDFFPSLTVPQREAFIAELIGHVGLCEEKLASEAALYATSDDVRQLQRCGVEVGNHTYTHVHCRTLTPETSTRELEHNKAELEAVTKTTVRSFSVPYGSSADLTDGVSRQLRRSGHEAVFLSESVANTSGYDRFVFDRVSTHTDTDADFFAELEVLPRLRALRNSYVRGRSGQRAEALRGSA